MTKGMTMKKRGEIFYKTNGRCAYCGKQLEPFGDWIIEHVTPRSKNGSGAIVNLLPACRPCNIRKRSRSVEEFRRWMIDKQIAQCDQIIKAVESGYPILDDDSNDTRIEIIEYVDALKSVLAKSHVVFWADPTFFVPQNFVSQEKQKDD